MRLGFSSVRQAGLADAVEEPLRILRSLVDGGELPSLDGEFRLDPAHLVSGGETVDEFLAQQQSKERAEHMAANRIITLVKDRACIDDGFCGSENINFAKNYSEKY